MKASAEQQKVVDAVANGANVMVDAVAGSGKTTTVLSIAKAMPGKKVIQITFNSQLKLEVRAKINESDLTNISVYTYHSVATTFYDRLAYNDGKIMSILGEDMPIRASVLAKAREVDVLIVDEAQDMTMLYYRLLQKYIKDAELGERGVQIVVLGDRHQGVYAFMAADTRFLTLAAEVWGREFQYLTLKESYRITRPIAWFINNCMVNEQRIVAKKPGVRVEYYVCNAFKHVYIDDLIIRIKTGNLLAEDVFVLCASLKSTSAPAKHIENLFVNNGISVYVPISDDARLDDDVTRGKVVFATFPSSKGRERKVVVVLGFDSGYFKYFARTEPPHVCPSTLYVACTRAKERLILVGSVNDDFPQFLRTGHEDFATYVSMHTSKKVKKEMLTPNPNQHRTSPTELVKFLKQDTIAELTPMVDLLFTKLQDAQKACTITSKIKSSKGHNQYEDVCDLNGLAIPTIWQAQMMPDRLTTIHHILKTKSGVGHHEGHKALKSALTHVKYPCESTEDFLLLCNTYMADKDGYMGRLAQIKGYGWLSSEMIDSCHRHLDEHVSKKGMEFESSVDVEYHTEEFGNITILGFIDAINKDTVWEFKCVDALTIEHMLQLVVYAWLYMQKNTDAIMFKIMNIRTGEILELVNACENQHMIQEIMNILIKHKFTNVPKMTDDEFVAKVNAVTSKPRQSS